MPADELVPRNQRPAKLVGALRRGAELEDELRGIRPPNDPRHPAATVTVIEPFTERKAVRRRDVPLQSIEQMAVLDLQLFFPFPPIDQLPHVQQCMRSATPRTLSACPGSVTRPTIDTRPEPSPQARHG